MITFEPFMNDCADKIYWVIVRKIDCEFVYIAQTGIFDFSKNITLDFSGRQAGEDLS